MRKAEEKTPHLSPAQAYGRPLTVPAGSEMVALAQPPREMSFAELAPPPPPAVGSRVKLCAGCGPVPDCPVMTVADLGATDAVCVWFGTDGSYHRHVFPTSALCQA